MLTNGTRIASRASRERFPLTVNGWQALAAQTEFGDYSDNLSTYLTVLYAMRNGFQEEGLMIIQNLRKRIIETGEAKSSEWLLPKLNSCFSQTTQVPLGEVQLIRGAPDGNAVSHDTWSAQFE
jgi:hypothetical protein